MRDQSISAFLEQLAARVPAPGGGASGALHAAQAAALLAMVGRYSDGPAYDPHRALVDDVVAGADRVRDRALRLAEEDAAAFGAVADAYRLPKSTDAEKSARSAAIAAALRGAAEPPADTVAVAAELAGLAERLLPVGNRNVLSDVGAAAESLRAAAGVARINIEVNLGGIKDESVRGPLLEAVRTAGEVMVRADAVSAAVREEITR
ncbi:putative methenyltetrahydrofolate cyclohydrolase [Actinacidiphila reveromycinica]|uniref:Putative methenyltetrahydrofolate cyclohydrolase n=1 Tax=Actinacidiphila reveromycinica TaxID=659352 RepID=A0A7U3V043_9ACTN|nr:cyclodeaminase/cyclohydrolase family protein [Streptomyces sp. SN-593]BBB01918.1 putative methenyltetrahydrofolate cyclohydrolase [Streptomyces sp. SN-593]